MDTLILYRDDADTTGLDLSSYVDVQNGGIQPGDGATRDPVWADGQLGYGQQLLRVSIKNRPFTVQLLLSGASRDATLALQRDIELRLRGARPTMAWTPDGATSATWLRIRHGRVVGDERYDERREGQTFYAQRTMLTVCEPYGLGSRSIGTRAPVVAGPTGPGWASVSVSSGRWAGVAPSNPGYGMLPSLGGDAEQFWRIHVKGTMTASQSPGGFSGTGYRVAAVVWGIMPTPYSVAGLTAGSAVPTAARMQWTYGTAMGPTAHLADPWAPGGGYALQSCGTVLGTAGQVQLLDQALIEGQVSPTAPPAGGLYRVWAAIRVRQSPTAGSALPAVAQMLTDGVPGQMATLAMRSPSQYAWYDLGDTADYNDLGIGFGWPTGWTCAASPAFNLSCIALMPKDVAYGLIYAFDTSGDNIGYGLIPDTDNGNVLAGELFQSNLVNEAGVAQQRGANLGDVPVLPPVPSGGSAMWLAALVMRGDQMPFVGTSTAHDKEVPVVTVAAWDRYTFAK